MGGARDRVEHMYACHVMLSMDMYLSDDANL